MKTTPRSIISCLRLRTACAVGLLPLLLLLLARPVAAQAQLSYTTNNGTITITAGCPGSAGAVTIPATINGLPVFSIADWAFSDCTSLTSVTIPNSVTKIGGGAFAACTSLTSITLPDSVTSIGGGAFSWSGLTGVNIPNGVANIGARVFSGCRSLTTITVDLLNSMYSSFDGVLFNKGLTTLVAYPGGRGGEYVPPSSITSIAGGAFWYCQKLTSITIPAGVSSIEDHTFQYCVSLTNVIIPNGLTNIGVQAFATCSSLTAVTIPESVTNIGGEAFMDCTGLSGISVDALNPAYSSLDGVLFDKHQTTLIQYPGGRAGDYVIPTSITKMAEGAFRNCASLTRITIPGNVAGVEWGAFAFCTGLRSVRIGSGVAYIGNEAFVYCTGLTSVEIPDTVTVIGHSAFSGCSSLASVEIPDTVTSIGYGAFYGCSGLTSVTIPNSVTSIGLEAFSGCTGLTNITIPDSVTSIDPCAFSGCTSLTGVYFSENAPACDLSIGETPATVYYLPGTTGWGATFDGRPTQLWVLPAPVILTAGSNLGVQANGFGFTISWATNAPVVVEAATDLANPIWSPVSTNTLTNGSSYFSDPRWINSPARFHRLRSP